jgi:hypothetical protein
MEIKFKNGSEIKVIETKEKNGRSKPKDFQFEDISTYVEYLKRHPSDFMELQGIKLYWWQKVYVDMISLLYSPKDKAEERYKELIKKYNIKESN